MSERLTSGPDDATIDEIGPVWCQLHGRLWHTTSEERLRGILRTGAILPEPRDIPNSERWKASRGPDLYPVVRFLGGVSLFDFHDFNAGRYDEEYPICSWREFVPYRQKWGSAAWIEIDRKCMGAGYISGLKLLERWKNESLYRHTIMPIIEAAHIGPLSAAAFMRVVMVGPGSDRMLEIDAKGLMRLRANSR